MSRQPSSNRWGVRRLLPTLAVVAACGMNGCHFGGTLFSERQAVSPGYRSSPVSISNPSDTVLISVDVTDHSRRGLSTRNWGETLQQFLVKEVGLRGFLASSIDATNQPAAFTHHADARSIDSIEGPTLPLVPEGTEPSTIQQAVAFLEAPPLMPGVDAGPELLNSPPLRPYLDVEAPPRNAELRVQVIEFSPYPPLSATLRVTALEAVTGAEVMSTVMSWKQPTTPTNSPSRPGRSWLRRSRGTAEMPTISPRLFAERIALDIANWHQMTAQSTCYVMIE